MEVVTFENQFWQDIPKQDNPALDEEPREECIIVCRGHYGYQGNVSGHIVMKVNATEYLDRRGFFWSYEDAKLFAETIARKEVSNGPA